MFDNCRFCNEGISFAKVTVFDGCCDDFCLTADDEHHGTTHYVVEQTDLITGYEVAVLENK